MALLTFNLPDSFENKKDEIARFIAAKLYDCGKVTLGQAAEMCGMKKWDFPAVLAEFDVAYFQYTGEDFLNEFK